MEIAEKIWGQIETMGRYAFNRSHSVAYSLIAYQTAYLKANYPLEYMCCLLNSVIDKQERLISYLNETLLMGIKVLPPDINKSSFEFTIEDEKIRYGLGAIKGVKDITPILQLRPISSVYEVLTAILERKVSIKRDLLLTLIKVGAFSEIEEHNLNTLLKNTEILLDLIPKIKTRKRNAELIEQFYNYQFNYYPELEEREIEKIQVELLGINPNRLRQGRVTITGSLTDLKEYTVKNGRQKGKLMATFKLEDKKFVIYPQEYERYKKYLKPTYIISVTGSYTSGRDEIIVKSVKVLF